MDPELRAYLEAMEGRLATKAGLDGLRSEIGALRAETAVLRTGVTELRTEVTEVRAEAAEQFLGLHVEVRNVRDHVKWAEERLDKSIKAWKTESSLALRQIERLHRSLGRLTRRVRRVELRRA